MSNETTQVKSRTKASRPKKASKPRSKKSISVKADADVRGPKSSVDGENTLASGGEHLQFLNGYYQWTHNVYDASRKWYLLGRDQALEDLLNRPWKTLIDIGAGTGRNLAYLAARRPEATYYAVEPCEPMREHLAERLPNVRTLSSLGEELDLTSEAGLEAPDVALFSYSLSMMENPELALEQARNIIKPGGIIMIVDFGDMAELPKPVRYMMQKWLHSFHTRPEKLGFVEEQATHMRYGPGHYWQKALITQPEKASRRGRRAR